jgi:hypothetical protein
MRACVRVSIAGGVQPFVCQIVSVASNYFRDFWIVSKYRTGTADYSLDVYRDSDDALAEQSKIAGMVHAALPAGGILDVPQAGGSPIPTGTIRVEMGVVTGQWGKATFGCVAAPEMLILDRVAAFLELYRGAGESLEGVGRIYYGHLGPAEVPAVGVTVLRSAQQVLVSTDQFTDIDLELVAWAAEHDRRIAVLTALRYAGSLRAIAAEQRRWGGMAIDTLWGDPALTVFQRGDTWIYEASVPIRVRLENAQRTRDPDTMDLSDGGKYAVAIGG